MKNTENNQETMEVKPFNMTGAVVKVIAVGIAILSVVHTAMAVSQSKEKMVYEALEANYTTAIVFHKHSKAMAVEAIENERLAADAACDSFRALKAYKELQKIPLKNDSNPCVDLKAPQEGYVPEVVPGAEGIF